MTAGTGNVISTEITLENGEQATVRGHMRREQVDEDKGKQPDRESNYKASGHIFKCITLSLL